MPNNQSNITIKRTDYKAIKHMNQEQMADFLFCTWQHAFEKGYDAALKTKTTSPADNDTAQSVLAPTT